MPCGGLLPFLQPGKKEVFPMNMLCQCPISGFSHFYGPAICHREFRLQDCVNALHRASPISTSIKKEEEKMTVFVSMPYIGLLPFLLEMVDDDTQDNAVCQCPTSGFSHFYLPKVFVFGMLIGCVNALHRASPISTPFRPRRSQQSLLCQCPTSGFSHFYCNNRGSRKGQGDCVNALHRASPISTQNRLGETSPRFLCQCPTSGFSHFYSTL